MSPETKLFRLQKRMRRLATHPDRSFYYAHVPIATKGFNDRPQTLKEWFRQKLPFQIPLHYMWNWEASLNYAPREGQTAVCMSTLPDMNKLRGAAERLDEIFKELGLVPVLCATMVDFPFFVRLGWQVEYLPQLSGSLSYADRKLRYIALRYREALFLPIELGFEDIAKLQTLLCHFAQTDEHGEGQPAD